MRLLWLSHLVPWPPVGGVRQRSFHLLREAAGRHEVQLLALNQRALLPTPADLERAVGELSARCERVEVFPIESDRSRARWASMFARGLLRPTPYDVNWLASRRLRARVDELAAARRFDLIHIDSLGVVPFAERFRGAARVLNHHNVESHMMARRSEKLGRGLRRAYLAHEARTLARFERRVCPAVEMNLVVSALDGDRLRRVVGDVPLAVVDNGVDVDYFRPRAGAPGAARHLIFAGGMSWYPNREAVRFLVREIWPHLLREDAERRLTVLGADPPPELLAAARDPRIEAPGFVDDVRPYLRGADAYVCPIRDGGGTRLKVLDALAAGLPLVATGLAVEGLELAEEEHYLRAETPADFAAQIGRLDRDASLRQRLCAAGRETVEKRYAWPVIGQKLERAYRAALSVVPAV